MPKDEKNMDRLGLSPGEYLRRKRNGKILLGVYLGGLLLGGAAYLVKEAVQEESTNPVCEIQVHEGDTITALQKRLKESGDDVRGEKMAVRAGDSGRLRSPDEDPGYFIDGSMAIKPGDRVLINNVTPQSCIDGGGAPIVSQANDFGEQPDFLKKSLDRLQND